MSPYDQNHPQLAYIQPRGVSDPPVLMVVYGQDRIALPLTNAMLWQLLSQATAELVKVYAAPQSPSL